MDKKVRQTIRATKIAQKKHSVEDNLSPRHVLKKQAPTAALFDLTTNNIMTAPTQRLPPVQPNREYQHSFWARHRRKFFFAAIGGLLFGVVLGIGVMVFYQVYVPKLIDKELKTRLARVEKRANVTIKTGKITPDGARGVKLEDFTITPKGGTQPFVKIGQMDVTVDRARLLAGEKVISALKFDKIDIHIIRHKDGQLNIERILDHIRRASKPKQTKTQTKPSTNGGLLRYFGGQVPSILATQTQVHFVAEEGASPFPLTKLVLPKSVLNASNLKTTIEVQAPDNPALSLPKTIAIDGALASPLKDSTVEVRFDKPLRVSGLPPYPFVEVGLSKIALAKGAQVQLNDLTVRTTFQTKENKPLISAKSIGIALKDIPKSRAEFNIEALTVLKPRVRVRFNEIGASDIHDLQHAIEAPVNKHILRRAKQVARRIHKKQNPDQPNEQTTITKSKKPRPSLVARLKRVITNRKVQQLIPNQITIKDAELTVEDARNLPVTRPTTVLRMADAALVIKHDGKLGMFQADGEFKAEASGNQPRGDAKLELKLDYRNMGIEANVKANMLDLSWVAQLAGPKLANKLRGGTLDVALKIDQDRKGAPVHFSGLFDVKHGYLVWPKLAEEPIEGWRVRYDFAGQFDRDATIPAAKLLKTALDANVPKDPDSNKRSKRRLIIEPPTKGKLVFTRGKATFGKINANVLPAFYGIDINKPLPARFDLAITMPQIPVQRALESIPAALLGELVNAKLGGLVKLNFQLEVPMYDASEMIWRGEPDFKDVSIQRMPNSMDVRKLTRSFRHTIEDDRVNFKRRVMIEPMSLIPAQWLMDNAGLSLADVDEHWRRGGWFEGGEHDDDTAQYWMTRAAATEAAKKPWGEDSSEVARRWRAPSRAKTNKRQMSASPYGPYVYVPLQHISPWLVRAILTTEDNSFFKHDGFNRHALKQSIERNIAAGDYVRGASTISMQLIKNIFLTRKKVMARKLQEAILVYLMESVVRVPKGRLMELYLNVIEFAPGVFGIHDAAVHYFGKRPSDLTLAECAWLVTIVPGPKKYHYHWYRGQISDGYWNRIKRYIKIIRNRERATEEEYQEAIATKPAFYKPTEPDAPGIRPKVIMTPPSEQLTPDDIQKLLPPMDP